MTREVRCPKREATEAVLAGAEAKSLCSNHVPLKERKKTALGKISIRLVAEVQEVVTSAAEKVSLRGPLMQQAEWEKHTDLTLMVNKRECRWNEQGRKMLSQATRRKTCLLPYKSKPLNRVAVGISLQKSFA